MLFKNFRISLIIRVLALTFTVLVFFFLISNTNYNVTPFLLIVVLVLQVISLIRYVERTNRYITTFLESIRYSEFTRNFQIEGLGSNYDKMKEAFNSVIEEFQHIRSEKEEHYHYLQNVIQHIGIALLAFGQDGEVILINNSAKRLFQVHYLKTLDALRDSHAALVDTMEVLKSGERKLLKMSENENNLQLAVYATEFKMRGKAIKLVSIQNIQNELEEQEMLAWQKLIRVLTHEIMNSITPIASLTTTVTEILKDIDTTDDVPQEIDDETIIDIRNALTTIHRRSVGLMHFVQSYRNLTHIPKPVFNIVTIHEMFHNIEMLMAEDLRRGKVEFMSTVLPQSLTITADENLIEQVLINLIKNSIHALEGRNDAKILLRAFMGPRGRVIAQVIDNGAGIHPDALEKIFIPFFTTKQKGSGIGLSLSRQIMRLHGGTMTVQSEPEKETCFTLRF